MKRFLHEPKCAYSLSSICCQGLLHRKSPTLQNLSSRWTKVMFSTLIIKLFFFFLNKANCLSLKCYECGRVLRTLPDHTPNAARLSRQLKKQTTVLTIHFPVLVKSNVQPVVVSTIRVKTVPQHAQVNNKTEICPLRCWFESVHFFFFFF